MTRRRVKTAGNPRTERTLTHLIARAIETGSITAFAAVLSFILFVTMRDSGFFFAT